MIHFHSHRRRLFHKNKSSWPYAALLALSIILIYYFTPFGTDAAAPDVAAAKVAFVAPQPNIAEPHTQEAPITADEMPLVKPAALPAPRTVSLTEGLSSAIQNNIASMLEPGSKALTSAKKVIVGRGDTLMDLLVRKADVPRDEAYQAVAALRKVYNPRDLNPGHEITVFFHKDPAIADPKFSGVRIEKDIINTVVVKRDGDDHYVANKEEKDVHRTLKGYRGKIDNSLYVDAKAAGVPDGVILEMIKMYSWNVDFQREIHNGDKFEVMFEEYKTDSDETVPGMGNILYAKLTLGNDEMPFYRYEDKKGFVDYYDTTGHSAKKPLMKTPIDGARISSGYGVRHHPVLGYTKMHKGIDFAAPRGTPIYAAGDGTIEKLGPWSTYGNYVRIRHRNDLKTAYAHMKGFKSGLHSGSHVKQGDVIGYVGTTGRSTGPHLHYEVMVNNRQVNPSSVKLPTGNTLKGKDLKVFKELVSDDSRKFNDLTHKTMVVAAADKRF